MSNNAHKSGSNGNTGVIVGVLPLRKYVTQAEKMRRHREKKRMDAIRKLADGEPPKCAICGCPHIETLHIGHPNHDGAYHKNELSGHKKGGMPVVTWILRMPLDVVKDRVQLECAYCNAYHNKFGDYPPPDKRPSWPVEWAQ